MGVTPTYSWPYPGLSDAPDGPAQIAALALAADSTLSGVESKLNAGTVQVFTASGTWTKPANVTRVRVRAVGAGGGGGGATGAASGEGNGAGGGGGGYCESVFAASALAATVAVTIGAGGAGGTSGAVNGTNGGNTTFGAHLTAGGGLGGAAGGTATTGTTAFAGGAAGSATNGNVLNVPGEAGGAGRQLSGGGLRGQKGGNSLLGHGGAPSFTGGANGNDGQAYGGGGSGALVSTVTRSGGTGFAGVVVVECFL